MYQSTRRERGLYSCTMLLSWPISVGSEPEMLFCWMNLPSTNSLRSVCPLLCHALHSSHHYMQLTPVSGLKGVPMPHQRTGRYSCPRLVSWPISVGSEPEMLLWLVFLAVQAECTLLSLSGTMQTHALHSSHQPKMHPPSQSLSNMRQSPCRGRGPVQVHEAAQLANLRWQ